MSDQINVFGKANFRNKDVKFGIKTDDRRRHMYLLGKTGMGKSVVLENMIIQDILAGNGLAVVDPHGDLVEKVIKFVPKNRINDVVYVNPADLNFPVAFNVLENVSEEYRHLVASGLLGVFKKIWADSWGPRLEYVLNNALMALLEYPGSTLLGVMRLLVDKLFRNKVIDKITDPVVKSFWVQEYSKYPDKFQSEAIAPIQNKVGRFLSSSMIRNIVGQVKSTVNLREIMDTRKILFLNLAKGRIGEDNSALLGAMIITKIQLAAMSRVDIPEDERVDFYLYVDEFQNFATESFASILSEARKYRLDLIMAHQYIEQLGDVIRSAVFGNVGTLVAFRIGAEDSEFLAKEFGPRFEEVDLVNLPKYHVYMKLMIDGVASDPFSATTLPPMQEPDDWQENLTKLIKVSREHYSSKKEVVEEKIIRWSASEGAHEDENLKTKTEIKKDQVVKKEENKSTTVKASEALFPAICTNCGNVTQVKFKPDPKRPVYCKDCLKHIKKGNPAVSPKEKEEAVAKIVAPEPVSLTAAFAMKPQSFKRSGFEPAEDNKNIN